MRTHKPSPTAWRSTPTGATAYRETRAEAQRLANLDGMDRGLEANDLFKSFRFFLLPRVGNRYGHELRCEVVMPEGAAQPGHGPTARAS